MDSSSTPKDDDNGDSHASKKQKLSPPFITDAQILDEFSHHQTGIARINNGSFGCCPSSIISAQRKWQLHFLRQPDDFYFNHLRKGILQSRNVIRNLINADNVEQVSIVDNATTGAAIVLQHIARYFVQGTYQKGDAAVMLHYAYGAVKKSIQAYVSRAGGFVIEAQLPFPLTSNDEIIAEFRKALEKAKSNGRKIRLAVIDHITSMPSVVIPVKDLVRICREEGVDQVFVDAAHAIGNVHIDMKEIGADFYCSNLHKWFFCPPSIAFLYCRRSNKESDLHHPVVSHEYGNGLAIESSWIGTRDYSSQLVVPSVIEFVNRFEGGIEGIRKRNHDAVVEMGQMLAKAWGTNLGSPPEMCCSMIMIGLPSCLGITSEVDTMKLRTYLRDDFHIEVPIHYQVPRFRENGTEKNNDACITGYVRISHQVYNKVEEYYRLRDAINLLVQKGITCRTLPAN